MDAPYVGSGSIDWSASFAFPLRRSGANTPNSDTGSDTGSGGESNGGGELRATDIYEALRSSLATLGHPNTPVERRFSTLKIQDRLYVNGRLRPDSPFLTPPPSRPLPRVDHRIIDEVSAQERGAARHYLVVRVATWAGEVETSLFFYAAVRGDMLYLEYTGTTLAPIAGRYHAIDSYERLTGLVLIKLLGKSLFDLIFVAPAAPLRLLQVGWQQLQRRKLQSALERETRRRLAFDYGSRLSLRELGAGQEGWFASADAAEIQKVIVRRAFGAVADLLDTRGYELLEFESRANVVINNSTTNLRGATITNSSLATGSAASAGFGFATGPKGR